jgi:glycosyltransferase involved in cell wall biosynthesis
MMGVMRRRLILLSPIEPAAGGNGLAMRTELFRRGAESGFEVESVVVPVAGSLSFGARRGTRVVPLDQARARAGIPALIANPRWRERLAGAGGLPDLARRASPGLADAVVEAVAPGPVDAVHVMRSYLAPLGVAVAERLAAGSLTLDLDEDDEAFARAAGNEDEASAYLRLLSTFGGDFRARSAASPAEAEAIAARHGWPVETIPNAVELPRAAGRWRRPAGGRVVLFVGNLTYGPNVEAARELVGEVLPLLGHRLDDRVRPRLRRRRPRLRRRRPRVRLRLVGEHGGALSGLAGRGVELPGFVQDLAPEYAAADVVVVPLRQGGGTRIKLLEAFAYGIPVVASPVAAAGLDVSDGHHLVIARDPERTAEAVASILLDRERSAGLAAAAGTLVRERYSTEAVTPLVGAFLGS